MTSPARPRVTSPSQGRGHGKVALHRPSAIPVTRLHIASAVLCSVSILTVLGSLPLTYDVLRF